MKRWVSGAMALIITFSCAQGSFAFASGDADDAAASALMEHSPEDAPEVDAADEVFIVAQLPEAEPVPMECELTLGDEEDFALTEEAAEVTGDAEADDAPRYARTLRADVAVLEALEGAVIAALGADSTVLVLEEPAADWLRVAFCTERGIVTGCVAVDGVRVLDAGETAAYLDALVANTAVAVYDGDLDRPLEQVACAFADAGEERVDAAEDAAEANDAAADEANDAAAAEVGDENADAAGDETADEVTQDAAADAAVAGEDAPAGDGDAANADDAADADGEANAADAVNADGEANADDAVNADGEANAEAGAADAAKAGADGAKSEADDADAEAPKADDAAEAPKVDDADAEVPKADIPAMEAVAAEGQVGAAEASQTGAEESAKADAETTAASQESTAAEAAFQLNMTRCVLGLRETYSGLSATGGTGSVIWTSSNKKIVRVDANTGVIKGLKKGKAIITATCGGATASVQVTVKNAPKKLRFKPKKLTVGAGGAPVQLRLGMGKGAASAGVTYVSSNDGVARAPP